MSFQLLSVYQIQRTMYKVNCKGPFIATQLNSVQHRVELSCITIDTLTDATQLSPTIGRRSSAVLNISELADATDPVEQRIQPISTKQVSRVFVDLLLAQHSLLQTR